MICEECDGKGRGAYPPTWESETCRGCGGSGEGTVDVRASQSGRDTGPVWAGRGMRTLVPPGYGVKVLVEGRADGAATWIHLPEVAGSPVEGKRLAEAVRLVLAHSGLGGMWETLHWSLDSGGNLFVVEVRLFDG